MKLCRVTVVLLFLFVSLLIFTKNTFAQRPLTVSMVDGTSLSFEYCWVDKNKIKFNVPGGTASFQISDTKALEEIIKHEELDIEGLKKMAITTESFDPLDFLAKYAKTTAGINVEFSDDLPRPQTIALTNKPLLVGPITRNYLSVKKIVQMGAKKPMLLIAVFFNSREPINPEGCYVLMFGMDEKPVGRFNSIVKFINVPLKQRVKRKITRYSYIAYSLVPANKEYWAYELRLTRFYWEHPQQEGSSIPSALEN